MPIFFIDITGQRFGRLVVKMRTANDKHRTACWLCVCDCGNETIVRGNSLRRGLTKSCGCGMFEALAVREKHGHAGRGTQSSTYKSWRNAISRCTFPSHPGYSKYGGAGVTVCDRWQSFENFLADMGERPPKTTIGRILDMGNYEPGNCIWQTAKEQKLEQRNKKALLAFATAA